MASIGIHTNGSQFYLSLNPMAQLNGRCVAFGRMVEGDAVVAAIEKVINKTISICLLLQLP
jgi:peptidyl-prolyl cis-trans isomerase-like 6